MFYDPVIARFTTVDKLADHPLQIDASPYAYTGNNPISRVDPDGNCWPCLVVAALEALTVSEVVAAGVAMAGTAIVMNGVNNYSKSRGSFSVQDGTVARPKLVGIKTDDGAKSNSDKADEGKKDKPTEAYDRRKHYGNTPKKSDRKALDTKPGEVVDHEPKLVKRYYEGDPSTGEKAGHQMTPEERKASANDRTRMKNQDRSDSNSQGGKAKKHSMDQKKKHDL